MTQSVGAIYYGVIRSLYVHASNCDRRHENDRRRVSGNVHVHACDRRHGDVRHRVSGRVHDGGRTDQRHESGLGRALLQPLDHGRSAHGYENDHPNSRI